jgi:threonine dehydratase
MTGHDGIPAALGAPTIDDVLAARRRLEAHLAPTPLRETRPLSRLLGARVFVKHENLLPTGAFKVRGGINLVSDLPAEVRARGLIAASTGNHGQSVAYAAHRFGVRATICVPEDANPLKVEAIRDLGADVVVHGRDFDEAREHCERLAVERGHRYVHSGDEPLLIAGVATGVLEALEEVPDADVVLVPVGGGTGAAGACLVAKTRTRHSVRVVGVQSESAPAAWRSWREGRVVEDVMRTSAEGLATRVGFELPQRILRELLDDFVLVSEGELLDATRRMIEATRTLVEPAGAAPLAGALRLGPALDARRVILVCSGANVRPAQLLEALQRPREPARTHAG